MEDIRYSRDMGFTHKEFFRLLPLAMGDHAYQVEGLNITSQIHEGSLSIVLGPQQERRIALMRIPFCSVDFHFSGVSEQQQQAFKQHFDMHFQRGGG